MVIEMARSDADKYSQAWIVTLGALAAGWLQACLG